MFLASLNRVQVDGDLLLRLHFADLSSTPTASQGSTKPTVLLEQHELPSPTAPIRIHQKLSINFTNYESLSHVRLTVASSGRWS